MAFASLDSLGKSGSSVRTSDGWSSNADPELNMGSGPQGVEQDGGASPSSLWEAASGHTRSPGSVLVLMRRSWRGGAGFELGRGVEARRAQQDEHKTHCV